MTPPSWRATRDVSIKDDLVEEVGRMVGYDSITPRAPLVPTTLPPANPERQFQHEARNLFADLGFVEVHNYSFISREAALTFGFEPASLIRVTNPIASDQELMRPSLLPGIRKTVVENAKHRERFRIFEIGHEIHKKEAGLPDEIPHLVAAIYDRHSDGADSLFALKHAALCLMPGVAVCPGEARPIEHPARAAAVLWKGETVGRLFELHPSLIETGRATVLDLDLAAVRRLRVDEMRYTPVRRYPSSGFDLSVIADCASTRRAWKPASVHSPDRWWNRWSSCGNTAGRPWPRAPRACRTG